MKDTKTDFSAFSKEELDEIIANAQRARDDMVEKDTEPTESPTIGTITTFDSLPFAIHYNIACFLPVDDYIRLTHTSSSLREILKDDHLWANILRTNFPYWVPFPFVRGQTKESSCPMEHAVRLVRNMPPTKKNHLPFPFVYLSDVRLIVFGDRDLCRNSNDPGFRLFLMHRWMCWKLRVQLSILGDYWWKYPDQRMGQAWDNMGQVERSLGLDEDQAIRAFRGLELWRKEASTVSDERRFRPITRIPTVIDQMLRVFHCSPCDYGSDPINELISLSSIPLDRPNLTRLYEDDFFLDTFEARWAQLAAMSWPRASKLPLVFHGNFLDYQNEFPKEVCVVLRREPVKMRFFSGKQYPSMKFSVQTGTKVEPARRFFYADMGEKAKLLICDDVTIIFPAIVTVKLGHDEVTKKEPSIIFELQSVYPQFMIACAKSQNWHVAGPLEGSIWEFNDDIKIDDCSIIV